MYKYENGGEDPNEKIKRQLQGTSNLQQLIDWTILQHGLFKTAPNKPQDFDPFTQAPTNQNFGRYNWMGANTSPTPTMPKPANPAATTTVDPDQAGYFEPITGQDPQEKKKKINWVNVGLTGLSLVDHFLPEQKINQPQIKPSEGYSANPYGTGSQAIAENGIQIKPSHRGLFTKKAKAHNQGVQEFASQVLNNKENYPSATVKQAVFAHNFGGRKAADGLTLNGGGDDPLTKKYGQYVKGREAWLPWVNKQLGNSTIKDLTLNAAKTTKLNPALLYASAMEEGMNLRVKSPDQVSEAYNNAKVDGAYPVDGFLNYGLDTFSDAYPQLVKKGYLKDDFSKNFTSYSALNEKKQKINTAAFTTDEAALQAKAAMIANSRDNLLEYAKKNKIELSPEAQDFFTLASYNGGDGLGQKMLQSYNKKGVLKDNAFLKEKPSSYPGVYDNVMHRIQGAQMLQGEHAFKNGGRIQYKNGGATPYYPEGTTHDLDTNTINQLLQAGYELDFE